MNKIYSRLGWFVFGVITGVVGVFIYQVFGKPVLPKVEGCEIDLVIDFDKLAEAVRTDKKPLYASDFSKPVEPKLPPGYEWLDRFDEWDSASAHDWQGFERSLDDIQPIYTGGE